MPFNIIEILRRQFNEANAELQKEMNENPASFTKEEYDEFVKIVESVNTAAFAIGEMSEGGKPLSNSEAAVAGSFYSDFIERTESCMEKHKEIDLGKSVVVYSLFKDIKEMLNVAKAQEKLLDEAAALGADAAMPSMNDILSDYAWVEDVFTEDPNIAEYKKAPAEKWEYSKHSIAENLEKYKESVHGLADSFAQHVSDITGDTQDPMTTFDNKVSMIQWALNTIAKSNRGPVNIMQISKIYSETYYKFDTYNLTSMSSDSLITDNMIAKGLGFSFDTNALEGDLDKLNLSEKNKKHFANAFSKLRVKPYNLGISAEKLDALNESSTIFEMINMSRSYLIQNNGGIDAYDAEDKNDPIYNALKIAKEIDEKAVAYIQGEPDAKPVDDDDIRRYLEALGNSAIMSSALKSDGKINRNYTSGIDSIESIAEQFPQFKDIHERFKQKAAFRMERKGNRIYSELAETPFTDDRYDEIKREYKTLKNARLLSDEICSRIDFFDMCRDKDVREQWLRSGTSEQRVLASIVDFEFDCAKKFSESDRSLKSKLTNIHNPAVTQAFFSDTAMTPEDVRNIDAYRDSLMRSPVVQDLISKDREYLNAVVENGTCGVLLYANNVNVLDGLDSGVIDVLTQDSDNLGLANSTEYTNVGNAMLKYASEAQSPEGASADSCKSLYEACTAYMYSHNSLPTSTNGKLRFNAAGAVMAKLTLEMLDKNTEMFDQVERDVKINMIRSKSFREEILKAGNTPFGDMAKNVAKVLSSELGKDMITGKLQTEELKDALLKKYDQLEISYFKKEMVRRTHIGEKTVPPKKDNSLSLS